MECGLYTTIGSEIFFPRYRTDGSCSIIILIWILCIASALCPRQFIIYLCQVNVMVIYFFQSPTVFFFHNFFDKECRYCQLSVFLVVFLKVLVL